MRNDIIEKKAEILQMILKSEPKSKICEFLNCKIETLNSYLRKLDIIYNGNQGSKGLTREASETSYKDYTENGKRISGHSLKLKLIKQNIKKHKCEICGMIEWNGKPIPIELHHINGNHFDNRLENLQILCPNCHAQQEGNSGASIGSKKIKKVNKKYFCSVCGIEMKGKSKTGKCLNCIKKESRKVAWPSKEELEYLIINNSFLSLAKKFGVSDKAIVKWCKYYNLPYRKKDINKLSS